MSDYYGLSALYWYCKNTKKLSHRMKFETYLSLSQAKEYTGFRVQTEETIRCSFEEVTLGELKRYMYLLSLDTDRF